MDPTYESPLPPPLSSLNTYPEVLHSEWGYTSPFGFLGERKRLVVKLTGTHIAIEKTTQSVWQRFLSLFFTESYDKKEYLYKKEDISSEIFHKIFDVLPVYNSEDRQVIQGKTISEIKYNLFIKLMRRTAGPELSQTYKSKVGEEFFVSHVHKTGVDKLSSQAMKTEKLNRFLGISENFSSKEGKSVSNKFLGHVLGDSFLGETRLEGGKSEVFVDYLKSIFTQKLPGNFFGIEGDFSGVMPLLDSFAEMQRLLDQISEVNPYDEDFSRQFLNFKKVLRTTSAIISEKIMHMKSGEQLVLPGGWREKKGGHAMIYVVKKIENDNYTFTCINTGSGINYHQSRIIEGKEKFIDHYSISNISTKDICSEEIYKKLYRLMVPYDKHGLFKTYGPTDIYEKIFSVIPGIRSIENNLSDSDFVTPQRSGTCTWQSVTSLLALGIQDKKTYKQLIIGIKLQTLTNWMNDHEPPLKNTKRNLIKFSCEALSRQLKAAYEKEYITVEQLKAGKTAIANCYHKYAVMQTTKDFLGSSTSFSLEMKYDFDQVSSISTTPQPADGSVSGLNAIPNLLDLTNKNLPQKVTDFHIKLQKLIEEGCLPESAERAISRFVSELVLKTESTGFWKPPVGNDIIEQSTRAFEQMMELHMQQVASLPKSKQKSPVVHGISVCLTNLIAQVCKQDQLFSNVLTSSERDVYVTWKGVELNMAYRKTIWFPSLYSRFFWIADSELRKAVFLSDQNLEKINILFPVNKKSFDVNFSAGKLKESKSDANIFTTLLRNPFFEEKMKRKDHLWISLSDNEKVERLIEKREENLPPALNSLINVYIKTNWQNNFSSDPNDVNCPITINLKLLQDDGRRYTVKIGKTSAFSLPDEKKEKSWENVQFKFKNKHFSKIIHQKYFDCEVSKFSLSPLNEALWTNKANKASFIQIMKGFSKEEAQAFGFIDSNPLVSLPQLFNFFSENPKKLNDKDFQWYLLSHVFYNNALEQKLSESDSLKHVWKEFLTSQIKLAKGENNQTLLLFLLYLKRMFPVFSNQAVLHEVLNELDRMEGFLDKTNPDLRVIRGLIASQKIAAIAQLNNKTIDTAKMLAKENLLYRAYADSTLFTCQENEIEYVIEAFLNPFLQELNLTEIANQVGSYFNVDASQKWQFSQPNSFRVQSKTKEGKKVEIDFLNGTVSVDLKFIGNFDKSAIIDHDDFQRLFAGKNYELFAQSISSKANQIYQCEIYDEDGNVLQIYSLTFEHPNLRIQKEVEGEVWSLIPFVKMKDLAKTQFGLPFSYDLKYWQNGRSLEIRNKNDDLYAICLKDTLTNDFILKKVNPGQPDHDLTLSGDADYWFFFRGFIFLYNTYNFNSHISSVLNWEDKCIEFPHFGLKFIAEVKGENKRFLWSENPTYWISADQSRLKTLPDFVHFISLENEFGQKKILIPKAAISNKKKGALNSAIRLNQSSDKIDCYAFSVSHTGHIKGSNVEENLYLAHLHIAQKNYAVANTYLDQKKINPLQGFNSLHYEAIKNILNHFEETGDNHPGAIAIQLHLLARLIYHGLSLPDELRDDPWFLAKQSSITDLVKKYKNLASHMTSIDLVEEDKRLLGIHFTEFKIPAEISVSAKKTSIPDPSLISFPTIMNELSKEGINVHKINREQVAPDQDFLAIFQENEKMSLAMKRELKRMREEIVSDCKNQNDDVVYKLEGDVEHSILAIDKLCASYHQEVKKLEEDIFSLANKVPEKSVKRTLHQLSLFGKKTKILSVDDIIILCMQGDMGKMKTENPALNKKERERLFELTKEFVVKANRYQNLQRSRNKLAVAMRVESSRQSELVHESLSELMHDSLIRPDEFEMHVFSYYAEITLRPDQIDIIRKMRADPSGSIKSQVFQSIMGSGKSKVILPLLALLNSTGKNIPVFMVPDSLFETNSPDLKFASGEYLQQEIETCYYNQNHELTIDDVKKLQSQLMRVKKNKSYLLTTPWTMHLLQLNLQTIRDQLRKNPSLEEMYGLLSSVLQDFKESGNLLCDEFDTVMDIDLEANRPIGPDEAPSVETSQFIEEFFLGILKEPNLASQLKIFSREEAQVDKADYEKLKPKLGVIFLELLKKQGLVVGDQKEAWVDYLCEKTKDIPSTNLSPKLMARIGDSLGMLNTLFFPALKENPLQHYGLSHETACPFIIPYDQDTRKPKEGSELSFYLQTLVRTFLYYSKEGVPKKLVDKLIEEYQTQAQLELLVKVQEGVSEQEVNLRFTKAFKEFSKDFLVKSSGITLDNITPFSLDKIEKTINADLEKRLVFARQNAIPQIKYYKEKISSNPYTLVNMFFSISGFTGTLANQDTYHPSIMRNPQIGIDGKSYNIFWKKSQPIPILKSESTDKGETHSLFETLIFGGYHALIDSGSWFRGVPNYKVAQDLIDAFNAKKSPLKGVVFINDRDIPEGTKGTFVVLEKGKSLPVALKNSALSPEERFTYYHLGTGLDMPQAYTAKALMTESRNMTTRDISQGGWRMRRLDRGQTVDFAFLPSFGKTTMASLLLHHTLEQAEGQEKQLVPSTFLLINSELRNFIEEKFKGLKFDSEYDWRLYDNLRPLLTETLEDDSWKLFALASNNEDTATFFSNYIVSKIAILETAFGNSEAPLLADLKIKLQSYVPLKLLPDQIKAQKMNLGASQLVQTQQKTQAKSESQAQAEAQQESTINRQKLFSTKMTSYWKIYDVPNSMFSHISFFSEDFCKACTRIDPVQSYLKAIKDKIREVDSPETFFSTKISFTGHFRSDDADYELGEENQIPFGPGTKPATLSLLIKNKRTNEIQLVYIAPDEAACLWKMFEMDKADPSTIDPKLKHLFSPNNRSCHVALYSPHLGIIQNGKETLNWEQMKHEPQMVALTTETKFWNGSLNYTKEEREYMEKWIARVDVKNFENMFLKNILRYRPDAQKAYPNSMVATLIEEAKKGQANPKVEENEQVIQNEPTAQLELSNSIFSYIKSLWNG